MNLRENIRETLRQEAKTKLIRKLIKIKMALRNGKYKPIISLTLHI